MDDARFGRAIRSLRLRRGWRQRDVAASAGVSQQLVSVLEHGHLDRTSLLVLRQVAGALEMRVGLRSLWRGGELDRLLDADHAVLETAATRLLDRFGWLAAVEVTFSRYGERGSADILAFHAPTRTLLVVEVKTVVADLQSLLRSLDAKVRLAPAIAREQGWRADRAVPALVVADGTTNRRRIEDAAPLLGRLALRGPAARAWLQRPGPATGLLLFLAAPPTSRGGGRRAGRQRMRQSGAGPSVGSASARPRQGPTRA